MSRKRIITEFTDMGRTRRLKGAPGQSTRTNAPYLEDSQRPPLLDAGSGKPESQASRRPDEPRVSARDVRQSPSPQAGRPAAPLLSGGAPVERDGGAQALRAFGRPPGRGLPANAGQRRAGAWARRAALIRRIERMRGSSVICYLTSLRPGAGGFITDDSVRVFLDHLLRIKRPVDRLDLFLVSNGGSGSAPWRLISLFREFARSFAVLLPYRAYSAATLLALGADEIVMHPFAEMGPIDPTVMNDYNPTDSASGKRLGMSVEDVTAYVDFVRSTMGIKSGNGLTKALEILSQRVHPLAIGNVQRIRAQSRLVAGKALRTHMGKKRPRDVDAIVENLASRLHCHCHPINRREARDEIKLKVCPCVPVELEAAMWELYTEYEALFENLRPFDPLTDIEREGIRFKEYEPLQAIIESAGLSSRLTTRKRFLRSERGGVSEQIIHEGWIHRKMP